MNHFTHYSATLQRSGTPNTMSQKRPYYSSMYRYIVTQRGV